MKSVKLVGCLIATVLMATSSNNPNSGGQVQAVPLPVEQIEILPITQNISSIAAPPSPTIPNSPTYTGDPNAKPQPPPSSVNNYGNNSNAIPVYSSTPVHPTKPSSTAFHTPTPTPSPKPPISTGSLSVGNSVGNVVNANTGNGGFFGGDSGSSTDIGVANGNSFISGGSTVQGNSEVGNAAGVQVNGVTGSGSGFGDSGSTSQVGASNGNKLVGNNGVGVGSLVVGNTLGGSVNGGSGDAGWLGANSGSSNNVGAANNNTVVASNGLAGSVGTSVNTVVNGIGGGGHGWGDGGSVNDANAGSNNHVS